MLVENALLKIRIPITIKMRETKMVKINCTFNYVFLKNEEHFSSSA
jgi:hypothetical protein